MFGQYKRLANRFEGVFTGKALTKGVLVQVVVEVLRSYRSLMRAHEPALQQRCNSIDARHRHMWQLRRAEVDVLLMFVAEP